MTESMKKERRWRYGDSDDEVLLKKKEWNMYNLVEKI